MARSASVGAIMYSHISWVGDALQITIPAYKGDQEGANTYPKNMPIFKADVATDEKNVECSKYPYRRVVGQLMYGMVHTMIGIMYELNGLSRYGNNPGPRHIEFLKHLLKYCKYSTT